MLRQNIIVFFVFLVLFQPALAEKPQHPVDKIRNKLTTLVPGMQPDSIKPTPVKGLFEVAYGAQILYFSDDGRYMFRGSLIDLDRRADLTERTRSKARKVALDKVSEDEMIVFAPAHTNHTITVFTDVDCPYCRKLHAEMDEYNKAGIKVRYLMFPRAGINSPGYKKAVSVWCAEDSNKALTKAKRGESIKEKSCNNPVMQQMELGQMLGVTGTPAIVLESGELMPGYRSAGEIITMLNRLTDQDSKTSKR
jgi:thiol:disulfide interchange protein DsbC